MRASRPAISRVSLAIFVKLLKDIKTKMTEIAKPQFWMREKTANEMCDSLKDVLIKASQKYDSQRLDLKKLLKSMVIIAIDKAGIPRHAELDELLGVYKWNEHKEFEMEQIIDMNIEANADAQHIHGVKPHLIYDRYHVCFMANLFQMAYPETMHQSKWTQELEDFFIKFNTAFWTVCEKMALIHCTKELANEDCQKEKVYAVADHEVQSEGPYYNISQINGDYQCFLEDNDDSAVLFDANFNVISDAGDICDISNVPVFDTNCNYKNNMTDLAPKKPDPIPKRFVRLQTFEKDYIKSFFTNDDLTERRAIGIGNAMRRFKKETGKEANESFFLRTWCSIRRRGTRNH